MNFDTQIKNNRNKQIISFIHFYSPDDGKSKPKKNENRKSCKTAKFK